MLLPPDLRDWRAPDRTVHCVMDAVKALDLNRTEWIAQRFLHPGWQEQPAFSNQTSRNDLATAKPHREP
jgi:hypothetical protein